MIRMLCLVAGLMSSPLSVADDDVSVGTTQAEAAAEEASPDAEPKPQASDEPIEPIIDESKRVEDDGFEAAIDRAFGAYLVGPIASVFHSGSSRS